MCKKISIIGAGPAGLTAAYELLRQASDKYSVKIFEESAYMGGISRTVKYKGNRMDMGGHRFFSKVPEVNAWWDKMMPMAGALPYDDKVLGRSSLIVPGNPDPEKTDRVMLNRNRLSRIFFNHKFFDYPISLKFNTIRNMGLFTTLSSGCSFLKATLFKRQEKSLEDFYINRFGKKLYSMFFESYTTNLWGRHPSQISPEWGAQRVKGLSVSVILKDMLSKIFHRNKARKVETSLIENFAYPKLGPGQLWEITADEIQKLGGEIVSNAKVIKLNNEHNAINKIVYQKDGVLITENTDVVISSMPLKDLIAGMDTPLAISKIASGLPYRDYMTIGVLLKSLKLKNETNIKTLGNIIPDDWIYVHDKRVKMGRIQVFNNWSPYLVHDVEHTVWLGLEYFCNEGDALWTQSDEAFAELGIKELITMGVIDSRDVVLDFHVERVKKAYPAYFDTYAQIDELRNYLDSIKNLYCIGRNGQHRYNNIDHSMCTAFEAVKCIMAGSSDKTAIWSVNTEQEYHEGGRKS